MLAVHNVLTFVQSHCVATQVHIAAALQMGHKLGQHVYISSEL